jgi:hypothetical protein
VKFTDEEVSMILSHAAAGDLYFYSATDCYMAVIKGNLYDVDQNEWVPNIDLLRQARVNLLIEDHGPVEYRMHDMKKDSPEFALRVLRKAGLLP